jgi:hypothetical protein
LNIELYDLSQDEFEQDDVSAQYPEVVDRIRRAMLEAHEPNLFWDMNNDPLFNYEAACRLNGVEPLDSPWGIEKRRR